MTALALYASGVLTEGITARPYLRAQLSIDKIDKKKESVNRKTFLFFSAKDRREIVYPDLGDVEFRAHRLSNQFEGFRLDIPSDQNSFVTVRNIDIVVDGAGLIPGSVSALYDFDVNKKGFWVQNLVKVDDGPQFRPIQDHSTALRFDSPVPIDPNDQRVKAPWFLSPLSVSIFLACMAIGFASLIVGVTLLAIRLRFSAMPAISNYLAVSMTHRDVWVL